MKPITTSLGSKMKRNKKIEKINSAMRLINTEVLRVQEQSVTIFHEIIVLQDKLNEVIDTVNSLSERKK